MPGIAAGMTTRMNAPSGPVPSTVAASSSSRGMVSRYAASIQMANGSVNVM